MIKKKRKQIFAILVAISLFMSNGNLALAAESTNVANEQQATNYAQTNEKAEKVAKYATSIYGETSVQYALIDNGKIVISGSAGYNDLVKKTKIKKDNIYVTASISKIFATVAVMQLVDQRKIDLDTPIVNYIPEFKMKDERYKKITPRMLLNHSSGLMGTTLENALLFGDNDPYNHDNFLKKLSTQSLKSDPGKFSVYCNDGFTLAEILVEKVTKKSFTKYMAENITKPLNMNNTKTPQDTFNRGKLAKIYAPGTNKSLPYDSFGLIGAGGVYSTAEDLCRFAQTFMKDNNGLLSRESIDAMQYPEYKRGFWKEDEDTTFNFGLGWDGINTYPFNEYNITALSKGGDSHYSHGNLTVLPEYNMAIAVLSSGGSSSLNQLIAQEVLLTALKEKGIINEIKENKKSEKPVQQAYINDVNEVNGYYGLTGTVLKVTVDPSGILSLTIPNNDKVKQNYVYTGNNIFASADGSMKLQFVKDNNSTYLHQSGYSTIPGLGQTALAMYVAQKLEPVDINADVAKAWKDRSGKKYFSVKEKYSSQAYLSSEVVFYFEYYDELPGYAAANVILDKNNAKVVLEIPLMSSRDLTEIKYYTKNKKSYVDAYGSTYLCEKDMAYLSTKKTSTVTIDRKTGDTQWFKISNKNAGKTATIKVPKNASFVVYSKNGECVNNYHTSKKATVKLPKGGYIGFVGSKNAKFNVTIK